MTAQFFLLGKAEKIEKVMMSRGHVLSASMVNCLNHTGSGSLKKSRGRGELYLVNAEWK